RNSVGWKLPSGSTSANPRRAVGLSVLGTNVSRPPFSGTLPGSTIRPLTAYVLGGAGNAFAPQPLHAARGPRSNRAIQGRNDMAASPLSSTGRRPDRRRRQTAPRATQASIGTHGLAVPGIDQVAHHDRVDRVAHELDVAVAEEDVGPARVEAEDLVV